MEKRLQSAEDVNFLLVNKSRGTYMPINISNSNVRPVDIEIVVEDDDCVLGQIHINWEKNSLSNLFH